jgi:dnd system-associated protein 4
LEQGVGMADARVKIAKDKAELVKALKDGSDMNGPFQTYADVIAFAAILGFHQGKRLPLTEISIKDPDRVPQDQFKNRQIIDLIALNETHDPKILLDNETCDQQRIEIFQEYANAGFEFLNQKFIGSVDYLDQILLLLNAEKYSS